RALRSRLGRRRTTRSALRPLRSRRAGMGLLRAPFLRLEVVEEREERLLHRVETGAEVDLFERDLPDLLVVHLDPFEGVVRRFDVVRELECERLVGGVRGSARVVRGFARFVCDLAYAAHGSRERGDAVVHAGGPVAEAGGEIDEGRSDALDVRVDRRDLVADL